MKILTLMLASTLLTSALAGNNPVGIFEDHTDVGKPKIDGSAVYDESTQVYSLKGAGYNIWFERDEFHFAYKKITGDFILTANFAFVGKGTDPHRKIGWMIRESLDDNASHISAVAHGDGLTVLQWRLLRGAFMRDPQDEIFAPKPGYQIIQLEREGKNIIFRAAQIGEPLQVIGVQRMKDMPDEVLAGLFITSHNPDVLEEARIWNVRIDKPIPANHDAYRQGWPGCRLEILNVADGMRQVIHESKGQFEAPNWMPDGKKLLFNEGGSLYLIPIEGGSPEKLNTGEANRINNDHGISFDGKMLAISHSPQGSPSKVYVLPLSGGTPRLITEKAPSYWHGWTADNKAVLYVAQRDTTVYNIYKSPVSGGPEVQLTFFKSAHVDGPEASPDGKYIYYNGSQSGTMQIWRMKPDGSGKEQLTFDEYNDWFPHISPDGRWIVFISFPVDIDPDAHPPCKRVMLRMMPANGGAPKVVAYLYGGQGTINVPSWSPDSKKVAFVSNSELHDK
jgi:Tol biopolymer transport system component